MNQSLNKLLYTNNKLNADVREHVIKIVNTFIEESDIPIDVIDVQIVGSQASFNYNDSSDLDVHIITNLNFDTNKINLELIYFQLKRKEFNEKYDLSIHNIPVEIYIDDINSNIVSNGIYSVIEDSWIKFPKKIKEPTYDISYSLNKWKKIIDKTIESGNIEDAAELLNLIYMIRRNSLSIDGEFGQGNIIFKSLRKLKYIDKLKEFIIKKKKSELILEQFNSGMIVNRME